MKLHLVTLLLSLTIIFLVVIVTLYPLSNYMNVKIPLSSLIALLVCLIPTTIGGLLSAIGIAGMDRVTRFNMIAMSGKAVESCGDVDTMILDKTGTITFGNRLAADFVPVEGVTKEELIKSALLTSLLDTTPEGKSVVTLAEELGITDSIENYPDSEFEEFQAQTKMSGMNLKDGTRVRKGASGAVKAFVESLGGVIPPDIDDKVNANFKAWRYSINSVR